MEHLSAGVSRQGVDAIGYMGGALLAGCFLPQVGGASLHCAGAAADASLALLAHVPCLTAALNSLNSDVLGLRRISHQAAFSASHDVAVVAAVLGNRSTKSLSQGRCTTSP